MYVDQECECDNMITLGTMIKETPKRCEGVMDTIEALTHLSLSCKRTLNIHPAATRRKMACIIKKIPQPLLITDASLTTKLSHGRGKERARRRRESGVFSDESVPIHGLKHGEPYGGDRLSDCESVRFREDERRLRRFGFYNFPLERFRAVVIRNKVVLKVRCGSTQVDMKMGTDKFPKRRLESYGLFDPHHFRRVSTPSNKPMFALCYSPLIAWIRELEYANIVVHFSGLKKDVKGAVKGYKICIQHPFLVPITSSSSSSIPGATTPTLLTPVPTNPSVNEEKRDATRRQLFDTEGNKNPAKRTATDN
ncbi:hypothetical protein M8C21_032377 [Ambrosia artemisiifolia]|uniref:Uncharacterized protein n=1 Tax=Ambrosia artemisiifolia TaxID=4212 RepID=A0AAD5C1Q4_AMBAR|nr:hypothetical protein M8C21_032377 [Ambrosia artemisiifolia]